MKILIDNGHGSNTPGKCSPDGRLKENVGTNHIRIFRDGRKMFDYYPLRMKLFDYHNWYQLTYPSFGNVDRKWEQELQEIICRISAA